MSLPSQLFDENPIQAYNKETIKVCINPNNKVHGANMGPT